jgi:hypothetical protein
MRYNKVLSATTDPSNFKYNRISIFDVTMTQKKLWLEEPTNDRKRPQMPTFAKAAFSFAVR